MYQELSEMAAQIKAGRQDYAKLEQAAIAHLQGLGWVVDYIEVRHAGDLQIAHAGDAHVVVLAAARLGKTRLIDNLEIHLEA